MYTFLPLRYIRVLHESVLNTHFYGKVLVYDLKRESWYSFSKMHIFIT